MKKAQNKLNVVMNNMENEENIIKKEFTGMVKIQAFLNGKLVEEGEHPIYKVVEKLDESKAIGIGTINPFYIETNELQDKDYEYKKIKKFIQKYIGEYAKANGYDTNEIKVEFINYGKTELVYVVTEPNGRRFTLLTKQPAVEFGKIKQEAEYLKKLKKIDDHVVAPINYYRFGDQELYTTPYINQARCIASDAAWGMYIPEPYYRFENFTHEQESIVNPCMIAKLVSLFDLENEQGISSCKIGGGDFMLPKNWEKTNPTFDNVIDNLYLIAAREKINCSLEQYLEIIRAEFSRKTIHENQDELLINHRGRVPMKIEDIELGIEMGLVLLQNRYSLSLSEKQNSTNNVEKQ